MLCKMECEEISTKKNLVILEFTSNITISEGYNYNK